MLCMLNYMLFFCFNVKWKKIVKLVFSIIGYCEFRGWMWYGFTINSYFLMISNIGLKEKKVVEKGKSIKR